MRSCAPCASSSRASTRVSSLAWAASASMLPGQGKLRAVERVDDGGEADERLDHLARLGCGPPTPRETRHFLYLPTPRDADAVARTLAADGWTTAVERSEGAWLVVAMRTRTLTPDVVRETRARLAALAAEHGGALRRLGSSDTLGSRRLERNHLRSAPSPARGPVRNSTRRATTSTASPPLAVLLPRPALQAPVDGRPGCPCPDTGRRAPPAGPRPRSRRSPRLHLRAPVDREQEARHLLFLTHVAELDVRGEIAEEMHAVHASKVDRDWSRKSQGLVRKVESP